MSNARSGRIQCCCEGINRANPYPTELRSPVANGSIALPRYEPATAPAGRVSASGKRRRSTAPLVPRDARVALGRVEVLVPEQRLDLAQVRFSAAIVRDWLDRSGRRSASAARKRRRRGGRTSPQRSTPSRSRSDRRTRRAHTPSTSGLRFGRLRHADASRTILRLIDRLREGPATARLFYVSESPVTRHGSGTACSAISWNRSARATGFRALACRLASRRGSTLPPCAAGSQPASGRSPAVGSGAPRRARLRGSVTACGLVPNAVNARSTPGPGGVSRRPRPVG